METKSLSETSALGSCSWFGEYACKLLVVLAPMPDMHAMVPSWLKNVDVLFTSIKIPLEIVRIIRPACLQ